MAISRREQQKRDGGGGGCVEACSVMIRYPVLWEFLTCGKFEDGSDRQTPSFTMFLDGGMLKACLNDKAEGVVAFASGSTYTAILEAFNEGLDAGSLDWRKPATPLKKRQV